VTLFEKGGDKQLETPFCYCERGKEGETLSLVPEGVQKGKGGKVERGTYFYRGKEKENISSLTLCKKVKKTKKGENN